MRNLGEKKIKQNKIVLRFYETPARNALARLPRELLAGGQAASGYAAQITKPVILTYTFIFQPKTLRSQIKDNFLLPLKRPANTNGIYNMLTAYNIIY